MTNTTPTLNAIFKPENVAVIGATEKEGSVGRTILRNLITNPFGGTIFPVNPKRPNVLGIQAHKSVLDIPVKIDLAVIVTPAKIVPMVIDECIGKRYPRCHYYFCGFQRNWVKKVLNWNAKFWKKLRARCGLLDRTASV